MSIFKKKSKDKTTEEIEEKKECNFELYDENDKKFYCAITTASITCNKTKCPFWR
jgi:hypothetical protein